MPAGARSILIAGYYGFGNAGDEAILAAMLGELRVLRPDLDLAVASGDPAATAARHGVRAVARDDLTAVIAAIRASDLVILGGGGLFQDYWPVPAESFLTARQGGLLTYARLPGARRPARPAVDALRRRRRTARHRGGAAADPGRLRALGPRHGARSGVARPAARDRDSRSGRAGDRAGGRSRLPAAAGRGGGSRRPARRARRGAGRAAHRRGAPPLVVRRRSGRLGGGDRARPSTSTSPRRRDVSSSSPSSRTRIWR